MTNDLNTLHAGWTFDVRADLVVVGTNPEMADYDNPRGELHGEALYLQAANERGDRRELFVKTVAGGDLRHQMAVAQRQADALNARAAAGKLPVAFERWQEARPVYGSDAYLAYGMADDLAWERANDE